MYIIVFIYVLNVGFGGGGVKIDIKKICLWNFFVCFIIGILFVLFIYFFFDYFRKRFYR